MKITSSYFLKISSLVAFTLISVKIQTAVAFVAPTPDQELVLELDFLAQRYRNFENSNVDADLAFIRASYEDRVRPRLVDILTNEKKKAVDAVREIEKLKSQASHNQDRYDLIIRQIEMNYQNLQETMLSLKSYKVQEAFKALSNQIKAERNAANITIRRVTTKEIRHAVNMLYDYTNAVDLILHPRTLAIELRPDILNWQADKSGQLSDPHMRCNLFSKKLEAPYVALNTYPVVEFNANLFKSLLTGPRGYSEPLSIKCGVSRMISLNEDLEYLSRGEKQSVFFKWKNVVEYHHIDRKTVNKIPVVTFEQVLSHATGLKNIKILSPAYERPELDIEDFPVRDY